MAKITRKNLTITPKADTRKLETYNTVSEGDKVAETVAGPPNHGCTDPTALNYAIDVKGCFNDNGIIVREGHLML